MQELTNIIGEKYPHIKSRIELSWGTDDGRKLLKSLLNTGFETAVAKSIRALLIKHDLDYPQFATDHKAPVAASKAARKVKRRAGIPLRFQILAFGIIALIVLLIVI